MTGVMHDVRHAIRVFLKARAFTLVAVATLALGIGANTAIFSVVHGLLLSPLPYPHSDRLVTIWQDMRKVGGPIDEWGSPGSFVDWRSRTDLFSGVAAVAGWQASLSLPGAPAEPLPGEQVTHDYFGVLQVQPALGRAFRPDDDVPNAPRVAILSDGLWHRRFGGDRSIVGRSIMLSGEPHEIVGVMPPGFRAAVISAPEIWRPGRFKLASPTHDAIFLRIVARLKDGVTFEQAARALDAYATELEARFPDSNKNVGITLIPMRDRVVGDVRRPVLALLGAVALVLLIACVNVANLLLARASSRAREIAVRLALGAARRRVIRQLLTESALLAVSGGVAGVLLAMWGVSILLALAPRGMPRVGEIGVNGAVLAYAAALTGVTALLFGIAPAWQAVSGQFTSALKEGGRGSTPGGGRRLRRALIVAEVAVALMLLVGGGLLLRTFVELQRTDLGFEPDHVLSGFVPPPPARYAGKHDDLVALYDRLLDGASGIPGVREAALASVLPLGGDNDTSLEIEGRPQPGPGSRSPAAWYRLVSASYFDVMGVTLDRGRFFVAGEAQPVVVINDTMARRYWPGENPVGRRIRTSSKGPWFSVIGVVNDVKSRGAAGGTQVEMFAPYWQMPELGTFVLLKPESASAQLAAPLRAVVASIDPEIPVAGIRTLDDIVSESVQQPRFFAVLAALFGGVALMLAAIGLYGVMAYTVAQRRAEIGVRLALGAAERQIFALIVGDGLKLTAAGLALGLVAALGVGRALQRLLFGVAERDLVTLSSAAAVLLIAAVIATYVPARRAMRTDPVDALRVD